MPFKVQLFHRLGTKPEGLHARQKVGALDAALQFTTFIEAQRAMNAWLDYGAERRNQWRGEVVRAAGAVA